jgi:hypothetical protein
MQFLFVSPYGSEPSSLTGWFIGSVCWHSQKEFFGGFFYLEMDFIWSGSLTEEKLTAKV